MTSDIVRLENKLVVVSEPTGVSVYDFDFELTFESTHPTFFEGAEVCVLRTGAIADYEEAFIEKASWGLQVVNSPDEHRRASELECWYPLITDLTPASEVFDRLPEPDYVEANFGWPVFVKGSRQTSRHNPALSVANDHEAYDRLREAYLQDAILHWQRPVVRAYAELEPIPGSVPNKVRPSREFRTFWWGGELVGWGPYWYQLPSYTAPDIEVGLLVAKAAAARVQVPFLVVDIARTKDGAWIVIECNDAQEAGYVGIKPAELWRNVLALLP